MGMRNRTGARPRNTPPGSPSRPGTRFWLWKPSGSAPQENRLRAGGTPAFRTPQGRNGDSACPEEIPGPLFCDPAPGAGAWNLARRGPFVYPRSPQGDLLPDGPAPPGVSCPSQNKPARLGGVDRRGLRSATEDPGAPGKGLNGRRASEEPREASGVGRAPPPTGAKLDTRGSPPVLRRGRLPNRRPPRPAFSGPKPARIPVGVTLSQGGMIPALQGVEPPRGGTP